MLRNHPLIFRDKQGVFLRVREVNKTKRRETKIRDMKTNNNDRLMRILQATPAQMEIIDKVLNGEVHSTVIPATGPLLLGMGAGAGFLGVSRATLWRMIRAGKLHKVEVLPGSFRVRRSDLESIAMGKDSNN